MHPLVMSGGKSLKNEDKYEKPYVSENWGIYENGGNKEEGNGGREKGEGRRG